MGVSGCGKTTLGRAVADALGWAFLDADDLHPPGNVAMMRAGIPLQDEDRWPWLGEVSAWIGRHDQDGTGTVVACSALRRGYRDVLRSTSDAVAFVHLAGSAQLLRERLSARRGHFMPASLLESQLTALQPLEADEPGLTLDCALSTPSLLNATRRLLRA